MVLLGQETPPRDRAIGHLDGVDHRGRIGQGGDRFNEQQT